MKKTLLTSYLCLVFCIGIFFGTPMISEAQTFCNPCFGQQDYGWNNSWNNNNWNNNNWNNNGWNNNNNWNNNGWNNNSGWNNGWSNNNNWVNNNGIVQSNGFGAQSIFTNGGIMQTTW